MKITNHRLEGVPFKSSPNVSGPLVDPSMIVDHFTGGASAESSAAWLCDRRAAASAHVVVDRDGSIIQLVPFNVRAWHAGVSTWRGRANCNTYSIGIEIANYGLLTKRMDGTFVSASGATIAPGMVVERKNKRGIHGFWEVYPPAQLAALDDLHRALIEAYPSIREAVGHEDIAPGRKIDPGPAFPLERYDNLVHGRGDVEPRKAKVLATSLNVRKAAQPASTILTSVLKGVEVTVLYDGPGWDQIETGAGVVGWVSDQYLSR
jgi:N-acetylmuramoyl-L-alanine amidase